MTKRIREEPVLFQGLIQTALALAVSFGLQLTPNQIGAILALTAAALSFWTRTMVTPVANPKTSDGTQLVPQTRAAGAGQ